MPFRKFGIAAAGAAGDAGAGDTITGGIVAGVTAAGTVGNQQARPAPRYAEAGTALSELR
jgi:hypothetical protein